MCGASSYKNLLTPTVDLARHRPTFHRATTRLRPSGHGRARRNRGVWWVSRGDDDRRATGDAGDGAGGDCGRHAARSGWQPSRRRRVTTRGRDRADTRDERAGRVGGWPPERAERRLRHPRRDGRRGGAGRVSSGATADPRRPTRGRPRLAATVVDGRLHAHPPDARSRWPRVGGTRRHTPLPWRTGDDTRGGRPAGRPPGRRRRPALATHRSHPCVPPRDSRRRTGSRACHERRSHDRFRDRPPAGPRRNGDRGTRPVDRPPERRPDATRHGQRRRRRRATRDARRRDTHRARRRDRIQVATPARGRPVRAGRRVRSRRLPHPALGGTIEFFRLDDFRLVAARSGYSTHEIGSRRLATAIAGPFATDDRPAVVVPREATDELAVLVRVAEGPNESGVDERVRLPLAAPLTGTVTTADRGRLLAAGTADGVRLWTAG